MACLLGSGLNNIFHWKAHLLILFKSLLNSVSEKFRLYLLKKSDVSSANILHIDSIPLGKSLIYIKNRRGPNTKPFGTAVCIFFQEEF